MKELIEKQRDLLSFLEVIDSNLEEEGLSVEDIEDALVGLSSQQDNFMNNVYVSYIHVSLPLVTYTLFDTFH